MGRTNILVIHRKEAKLIGAKKYFTNIPCKHGHIAEKYTRNGGCIICSMTSSEKKKINHRNWRRKEENKLKLSRYSRNWRINNLNRAQTNSKIRRKNNKDKICMHAQNRRAISKGAEGYYIENDVKKLFHDQHESCIICGRLFSEILKYTIDHIIPLSKGGSNWPCNIQLLCGSCNYSKGAKYMEDWLLFRKTK